MVEADLAFDPRPEIRQLLKRRPRPVFLGQPGFQASSVVVSRHPTGRHHEIVEATVAPGQRSSRADPWWLTAPEAANELGPSESCTPRAIFLQPGGIPGAVQHCMLTPRQVLGTRQVQETQQTGATVPFHELSVRPLDRKSVV